MTGLLDATFVLLILTALALLGSSRIRLSIRILATQGVVVGLAALLLPNHHIGTRVIVVVLIVTALNAAAFPVLLLRAVRTARVERLGRPPVGYSASILIGVALLTGCLWGSRYGGIRLPHEGANPLELPVAGFIILAGLFMIVARNNAINQVLGYLMMENGILKGYLQDKMNARLMGMKPTGNGRRESYSELVMPRMTNTYMRAGSHDPAEIIASVGKGLYAVNFSGGQVDITSGNFVFSASEAYLIEDGKVTAPVKGATIIGNGPDALNRVTMVGSDLQLDTGIGVCGKEGQSVPVGVGQPTLKIEGLTVGGTG